MEFVSGEGVGGTQTLPIGGSAWSWAALSLSLGQAVADLAGLLGAARAIVVFDEARGGGGDCVEVEPAERDAVVQRQVGLGRSAHKYALKRRQGWGCRFVGAGLCCEARRRARRKRWRCGLPVAWSSAIWSRRARSRAWTTSGPRSVIGWGSGNADQGICGLALVSQKDGIVQRCGNITSKEG